MPASVSFASAGHGWVLGDAPCATPPCTSILRTRDGGRTWHGIPAPKAPTRPRPGYGASAGNASGLSQIRFANDVDGWAFGNLLYSTHDGGATWVQQPFAGGEGSGGVNIEALEASASRVTALAARCPQPGSCETIEEFRSAVDHDDWRSAGMLTGANQQVTTLASHGSARFALIGRSLYSGTGDAGLRPRGSPCGNAPGSSLSPDGLAVADETHLDVICAGNGAMGHADNQLVGSTDGGITWKPSAPVFAGSSGTKQIADNSKGVLLLADFAQIPNIRRTTDDGARFDQVLPPPDVRGDGPWMDLGFTTPDQAVVVFYRSVLYLSHDAGATWSRVGFAA